MSNYVRAKRKNQTVFLYYEPQETIKQLQQKLGDILKHKSDELRFVLNSTPLEEAKTVGDYKIENDAVLPFVFRHGDTWEDVNIKKD